MMTTKQQDERRAGLRPHPVRDQIVDVMRSHGEPISPTEISRITGRTLGSVAYHVRTLRSVGVIELADEARVRGAVVHFYKLAPDADKKPLTDPVGSLLALCGALTVSTRDSVYPQPVALDDDARTQLSAIVDKLRPEVRQIATASTLRVANGA